MLLSVFVKWLKKILRFYKIVLYGEESCDTFRTWDFSFVFRVPDDLRVK